MQIAIANEKAEFHSSASMNTQISKGTSIPDLSFCVVLRQSSDLWIYIHEAQIPSHDEI